MKRREFLKQVTVAGVAGGVVLNAAAPAAKRKMTISLSPGSIGVSVKSQAEIIDLARRHGFEAVEARGDELAKMSADQVRELVADLKAKGLVWGSAGLPVDFRGEEAKFATGLKALPAIAAGLQRAGVARVGTWITPAHDTLTYRQLFQMHVTRLRQVAQILKDHGCRFGLEYVGTMKSRNGRRFPFLHTMAETKELIAEIGTGNVGLVLDSWHWWTAGDTEDELLALKNDDIVSVDLNDAPVGVQRDDQIDNQRELPAATGVIDVATFLNALNKVGYDGPVRAEPFNKALNALDNEAACAATIKAMKEAFKLIR